MGFKLMNGVHEAWINEVMETNTCTKGRIWPAFCDHFLEFFCCKNSGKQQALKGSIDWMGVWICCVYSLLIPFASFHLDKSTSLFLMSN
jgi:hypothetical protein